jgi:isopropylmalate/homocitrate/citramalate synthase
VVWSPEDKIAIARQIDRLGVERIEVGFPQVSDDDQEAIAGMVGLGLQAELWGFGRALPEDVEVVAGLGLRHMVIESPVSDVKLRAYGYTPDDVLARIRRAVRLGADADICVAFFGVDSTRADLDFLRRVHLEALDAGAREIAVVDTLGVATPDAAAHLVAAVREWVGDGVPLHFHGHNDFGLGAAVAVAAARTGARWIHGTVNGMGERAGNVDLLQVALALRCLYGVVVGYRFEHALEVSTFVAERSRYHTEPWKPGVGPNLFLRETGAVARQWQLPEAIEPYPAELVGATRRVVLGKKSGAASIALKSAELGLRLAEEDVAALLALVKDRSTAEKRLIDDGEFIEMAGGLAGRRG